MMFVVLSCLMLSLVSGETTMEMLDRLQTQLSNTPDVYLFTNKLIRERDNQFGFRIASVESYRECVIVSCWKISTDETELSGNQELMTEYMKPSKCFISQQGGQWVAQVSGASQLSSASMGSQEYFYGRFSSVKIIVNCYGNGVKTAFSNC